MDNLPGGLVMVVLAVVGGGLVMGGILLATIYEAAKEAREYYRRANAAHRHDGDPSMP